MDRREFVDPATAVTGSLLAGGGRFFARSVEKKARRSDRATDRHDSLNPGPRVGGYSVAPPLR